MTNDNLGCGHCGRPLDLCDCGADYEIAWRPSAADLGGQEYCPMHPLVLVGMVTTLIVMVVSILG